MTQPACSTAHSLRSVHTPFLPALLQSRGISVVVSTYQANKLVLLRSAAPTLNTHFVGFDRPMGVAWRDGVLGVGTTQAVWTYQNHPGAAQRVNGLKTDGDDNDCDAAFLPRSMHVSGHIDIHDLGFDGEGHLWGSEYSV